MNHISVHDQSNERRYFTMAPNCIFEEGGAVEQALYMQMKRHAGENQNGECWASKNTLRARLNVGKSVFSNALKFLIDKKWILEMGTRTVPTKGGPQSITVYAIRDIWKENILYFEQKYKGGSKMEHLPKGGSKTNPKGGPKRTTNKNHINKIEDEIDPDTRKQLLVKMKEISSSFKVQPGKA